MAHRIPRWLVVSVAAVAAACMLVCAGAVLVNLPAFDEPLVAELEALKAARPATLERNAYPIALGFLAPSDSDPKVAGEAILEALHQRYEDKQHVAIPDQEMRQLLGGTGGKEEWQLPFKSLECNARVYLDCADRLIAEVATADGKDARRTVLVERFRAMLHQRRFDEGQERDTHTPFPPYGPIRDIARIQLALSFRQDTNDEFLANVADQFQFWKTMLRDGETLVTKMIGVAGIQNTLDFISAFLRSRALTGAEVRVIQGFLTTLAPRELDISDAFLSEARISVLTGSPWFARDASLLDRLTFQNNATLNETYLNTLLPMRLRAKLSPREFYRQEAYQPLNHARRTFPPSLFNWGGNRLSRNSGWDPEMFVARTHDENGRIILVLLQTELELTSGMDLHSTLSSSPYRNPYTGAPMEYEPESHTIGFRCLHTVYHPPASPDRCAVRIN